MQFVLDRNSDVNKVVMSGGVKQQNKKGRAGEVPVDVEER